MHTSHHHRDAFGSKPVRYFISPIDVARHRGDSHETDLEIEIDRLDVLVGENHLIAIFRNTGGDSQQAGKRGVKRPIEINWSCRQRVGLRIDEMDQTRTHENLPAGPACKGKSGMGSPTATAWLCSTARTHNARVPDPSS